MNDASFVTVPEAGHVMGVSPSTIWRLIRRGELPSVRKKGRRLVPRRALSSRTRTRQTLSVPPFDERHPVFRLVGAGRSGGRAPGARDKHAILDAK
ncbi:MAG: helix-turn-helix domain-containing protein [Candidatus Binatia bacterium]